MNYQIGDKVWIFYDIYEHPIQAEIEGYVGGQYLERQWWVRNEVYSEHEIFVTKELAEISRIMAE